MGSTRVPAAMMMTRTLTVRFLTPAFLGGADQSGQWRAPPFKHLLREWWRVAWAEAHGFSDDVPAMREAEGGLFGTAAEGAGFRSRVRIRLGAWRPGRLKAGDWPSLPRISHPEVKFPVDAGLYLGYGPVTLPPKAAGPTLKSNAAIQAGESVELRLACPGPSADLLERTLALIEAYGTLGGRSRNGWGSLSVGELGGVTPPLRQWRQCLDRGWPHAIGRDARGPLVWQTRAFEGWPSLMGRLAELKVGLRTGFTLPPEKKAPVPGERHWLAYPVTHHGVKSWGNRRLPNSLRFKVRPLGDGRLVGVIFHMPCLPPPELNPKRPVIEEIWQKVHERLDDEDDLERTRA